MNPATPLRTVIVYTSALLPYSETFIKSQALALRSWHPVLVGERVLRDGLPLAGLEIMTLLPDDAPPWQRLAFRLARRWGRPHPGVLRRLRSLGAELVHAHFGPSAIDIWPYARELGLPMLVTLHGYDINIHRTWWESGQGGRRQRSYPAKLLRLARESDVHFIAVSEAIARRAVAYGIPRDKISLHYIGVDTALFAPNVASTGPRAKRVLFVGRLVEKKGTTYLLQAFARVRKRVPDAELVIVGDGPLRAQLEQQAVDLGIAAIFTGALPGERIRHEMAKARVLCLPSVTASNGDAEGLGLVLLEAQASGLPVVTSARGGAEEAILHSSSGFRHGEMDVATLEEHIVDILADDLLFERLSTCGVNYVGKNFDLFRQSEKLSAIYAEMSQDVKRP